jgi:hypothetical protein
VCSQVFCELPKLRTKVSIIIHHYDRTLISGPAASGVQVIECSAKTNVNIQEIFKTFLQLAKIPDSR